MSREISQLQAYCLKSQESKAYRRKNYDCQRPEELAQVVDELPNQVMWIRNGMAEGRSETIAQKAKAEGWL